MNDNSLVIITTHLEHYSEKEKTDDKLLLQDVKVVINGQKEHHTVPI